MELTALLIVRLQFAFTVTFHIFFAFITIGLAAWLAILEHCVSSRDAPPTDGCSTSGDSREVGLTDFAPENRPPVLISFLGKGKVSADSHSYWPINAGGRITT